MWLCPQPRFSHLHQHLDWFHFVVKKRKLRFKNIDCFLFLIESAKEPNEKIRKEHEKLWQINVHLFSIRKQNISQYKLVKFRKLNFSHLPLTKLSGSVSENLSFGCVYRPHCVRFIRDNYSFSLLYTLLLFFYHKSMYKLTYSLQVLGRIVFHKASSTVYNMVWKKNAFNLFPQDS